MTNYNLPKVSENHRWFLARHSNRYACLKLQRDSWHGWVDVESELVSLVGPLDFETVVKQAASEILLILDAPDVEYGVVS